MSPWSRPQLDFETRAGVAWPSATVWRARLGFASESFQAAGNFLMEPDPPPSASNLIADWFTRCEADLRLRVLLVLAPRREESAAWLGLGAVAGSHAAAVERLAEVADDLGEALDTFSLFPEAPEEGPPLPEPMTPIDLSGGPARAVSLVHGGESLATLASFTPRGGPVVLDLSFSPSGGRSALTHELEAAHAKVSRMLGRDDPRMVRFAEPDPSLMGLESRLRKLIDAECAVGASARLWGQLPGAVLRPRLLGAIAALFDAEPRVAEAEAAPLTLGGPELARVLGLLRAGDAPLVSPDPEDDAPVEAPVLRF